MTYKDLENIDDSYLYRGTLIEPNPQIGFKHDCPMCGCGNTQYMFHDDKWRWVCHECRFMFGPEMAIRRDQNVGE